MNQVKLIILCFLSLCSNQILAQIDNTFCLKDLAIIPTKQELTDQLSAPTLNLGANNYYGLTDNLVINSTPVLYMEVMPSGEEQLTAKVDSDRILLWIPDNNTTVTWYTRKTDVGYNLNGLGKMDIPDSIRNQVKGKNHIFALYILPNERYSYNYIAYIDGGSLRINDLNGHLYNSLEGLVTSRFGSIKKYAHLYKNKIMQTMNGHEIVTKKPIVFYVMNIYNDNGKVFIKYWNVDKAKEETMPTDEFFSKYTMSSY